MAHVNSGAFTGVSGVYVSGNGLVDASFFHGGSSADAYNGVNKHSFGFYANTVVITNEGANDLCYVWPCLYGSGFDSGVIKSGATVVLRQVNKNGIDIRSRNSGSATTYLVSAI